MLWWKLQRLKSRRPKTRIRTIEEFAEAGESDAVEPIAQALQDEDANVRVAAAKGLGVMLDTRALPSLVTALRDSKPEVRAAAVGALRNLGGPKAVDALLKSLEDRDYIVRSNAAGALDALGWRPSKDTELVLRSAALGHHETAAEHGDDPVKILTSAINDPTAPRRHAAVAALGKTGDPRAVKPLEAALKDEDMHVRVAAIEALGQLGHAEAATELLRLLRDQNHLVRSAAVEALGRLRDARVVEPIGKHLLKDDSWDVRKLSVETLGRIRDPQATELLWQALKDSDHDVRQTAIQALAQISDTRSIGPLVLALTDENSCVRHASKAALRRVDKNWEISPETAKVLPQIEAAVHDKEYWVSQSASDTLAKINDARQRAVEQETTTDSAKEKAAKAIAIFVDLLGDFDRDMRLASADALGRMNDFKAITPLVNAMDDSDEWVGRAAALALNHLNWSPDATDSARVQKMKTLLSP